MKLFSLLIFVSLSLTLLSCKESTEEELETTIIIEEASEDPLNTVEEQTEFYARGVAPDGSFYIRTVSLVETSVSGTMHFTWLDDNVPVYTGVGLQCFGDLLAVGTEGPKVKLYQKTDSGYQGIFFTGENLGVEIISSDYSEDTEIPLPSELFQLQPWPGELVFEMSGTNPDETEYTGIIQSRPLGDGAQLLWTQDDGPEIAGGAIMLENKTIIAAYAVGVIVYEYIENNVWRGEWYSLNDTNIGVEFITPLMFDE